MFIEHLLYARHRHFRVILFNPPNHTVRKISLSPIFIHNTTEDLGGSGDIS